MIEFDSYKFVDDVIKPHDIQTKEELDCYIAQFGQAYEEWDRVEILNPTATRLWFLLKELKKLRQDALVLTDESGSEN